MSAVGAEFEALLRRVAREELELALAERERVPAAGGLVTVKAFAAARSLSTSTVRKLIASGRLEAIKVGRAVRVASDAVIGAPVRSAQVTAADRARAILGAAPRPSPRAVDVDAAVTSILGGRSR